MIVGIIAAAVNQRFLAGILNFQYIILQTFLLVVLILIMVCSFFQGAYLPASIMACFIPFVSGLTFYSTLIMIWDNCPEGN